MTIRHLIAFSAFATGCDSTLYPTLGEVYITKIDHSDRVFASLILWPGYMLNNLEL